MKFYAFIVITIVLIGGACKSSNDVEKPGGEYKLVWSDEFEGTALSTTTWNFDIGGEGWGNNEQQYYTDRNATVENGHLVITAKKEQTGSNLYTSSRITSKGKKEFRFGKIEARLKIPTGLGVWPAFWMLGANIDAVHWPDCGEIDIMEHINTDSIFYGTLHWTGNNGLQSSGNSTIAEQDDFHVFAIEWDAAAIRWYLDNKKYHEVSILNSINKTEEFQQPFYFLLNVAIGGNWPGQTIDESRLPAKMEVDYVRVYQKD